MRHTSVQVTNFLHILRSGAFDESKPIAMMSPFKWDKLVQLAILHHLIPVFANGLQHYQHDNSMNMPEEQIETIRQRLKEISPKGFSDLYVFSNIQLRSKRLNERLQKIIHDEYASDEKSYETMQIMAIIIVNIENILSGKSYLKGIVDLGRYLRQKGQNVDFVKLDQWLFFTCMTSMANLQGNLLIQGFGFNKNEIPFVHHEDKHSQSVLIRAIRHDDLSTLRVWDFHPSKSGFIVSSPKSAIKSIRHCLSYRRYAPRETMATLTNGLVNGLAEIEE